MYNINGDPSETSWPSTYPDDGEGDYGWGDYGWWDKPEARKVSKESVQRPPAANGTFQHFVEKSAGLDARGRRHNPSSESDEALLNFNTMMHSSTSKKQAMGRASDVAPVSKTVADDIMRILCETNPDDEIVLGTDVVFTDKADNELRQWLWDRENTNYTLGVVEFLPSPFFNGSVEFNYRIMYNGSYNYEYKMTGAREKVFYNNIQYEIEAALQRSFWLYHNRNSSVFDAPSYVVNWKNFPKPTPANAETRMPPRARSAAASEV